jgi:ribosomal protein S18 acetylase RimI-like enzyme
VFLLRPDDEPALEELLWNDPVVNLFLLGMMETGLDRAAWYGIRSRPDDPLRAVAMVLGRLCVPFAPRAADATRIGRHLRAHHSPDLLVGPRSAVDSLLAAWTDAYPDTVYDQRLYLLDRPPNAEDGLSVERARPEHAEHIARLSAEMEREDLGRGPLNPDVHLAVVRDRIDEGRTWVRLEDGEIVFLINVGTRHPQGCQVGGTYVPPEHRGRRLASRCMVTLGRQLLDVHPRVTLHVNEANIPAVKCYEHSGFRRYAPFRLTIVDADPFASRPTETQ